jgi:hypothetical protein
VAQWGMVLELPVSRGATAKAAQHNGAAFLARAANGLDARVRDRPNIKDEENDHESSCDDASSSSTGAGTSSSTAAPAPGSCSCAGHAVSLSSPGESNGRPFGHFKPILLDRKIASELGLAAGPTAQETIEISRQRTMNRARYQELLDRYAARQYHSSAGLEAAAAGLRLRREAGGTKRLSEAQLVQNVLDSHAREITARQVVIERDATSGRWVTRGVHRRGPASLRGAREQE